MNHCKITYIYALYEIGKENEIRYIGKSDNPIKRHRDHRNDKRLTSHKSCWVKSVLLKGSKIGMKVIAAVDAKKWKEKEIFYIKEYKKTNNLTNHTEGGNGKMKNIYYKNLQECKKWLKENKPDINTMKSYKIWSKSESFPDFLPKAPDKVFTDWITWGDFLGTGRINTNNRKYIYLSYEEAKNYLKENYNIKNSTDFKKTKVPIFIPKKPFKIYSEWNGWGEFLGYKPFRRKIGLEYLDYESAKKWIKENFGNMSSKEYREISKIDNFPLFLPKKPERYYKHFKWSEYLYSNGRRKSKEFYIGFEESRKFARSLNLKTNMQWRKWCKNKPNEFIRIPSSPDQVYEEWIDWYDWLGN